MKFKVKCSECGKVKSWTTKREPPKPGTEMTLPCPCSGFEKRTKQTVMSEATKRKIRLGDLKKLLRESLLREEEEVVDQPEEEGDDSLDSQVDRFLAQYENEAKSSKTEGKDFRMLTRRILDEAEGDEKEDDDALGGEGPSKPTLDDIDVESFANSVVRLIDNYDSLLEVRSTLARRAINFIAKTYSPDVAEALSDSLRDNHGLVPGKSEQDVHADEFEAPAAERAGGMGAAGGGAV